MHLNTCLQRRIVPVWILALTAVCACGAADLPVTPAETLTGQKLEFPTALAGRTAVAVFGFSKIAGDHAKAWMSQLSQDGVNAWSVANLEGAPAFVRGMIRSSMRKGTAKPLLERSLVMTKDDKAWKSALGVKQDSLPIVVLLDGKGQVLWTYEGLFADAPYRELKTRLSKAASERIDGR